MTELRVFVPIFLPLYHLVAAVVATTVAAAAMVAAAGVDGGQRTGRFSGGNARDRKNFGRRPVALSQWHEYSNNYSKLK